MRRFFEKVKKGDGCWEWTAAKNEKGYGVFNRYAGQAMTKAHRVSYVLANGSIPSGKWVLHHCDNPGCVNPEHLFLGDNTANVKDMHRKGRGSGPGGPCTNPETAFAILWRCASGENKQDLASEYGVTYRAVRKIVSRETWQSLSELHD